MGDNNSSKRREFAPRIVYLVFDGGDIVESFSDEDEAYDFAGDDEYVVTYEMAGQW